MKKTRRLRRLLGLAVLTFLLGGCSQLKQTRTWPEASTGPYYQPGQLSPLRQGILNSSFAKLGVPYRYGGSTLSGLDCSALTQMVYRENGLKIPRTTKTQIGSSRTVPVSRLQPGDLVFYKTGRKSNHVGIYIGDRRIIHASTSRRKVIIDKMDSNYWRKRFLKFGSYLP